MGLNSIDIHSKRALTVNFKNTNNNISYRSFSLKIGGLLTGKRTITMIEHSLIYSRETKRICLMKFGDVKGDMTDKITGFIYKCTDKTIDELIKSGIW